MTPEDSSRVTVAELGRRMVRLEEDFKAGLSGLHRRLDELNYIHPETFALQMQLEQAHRESILDRVGVLEASDAERKRETAANRRLALTGLVFPIVTALAVALIMWAIFGSAG